MAELGVNRTYVLHLYDAKGRDYSTRELPDVCHEEALITARALAENGRVDLWLERSKVGSFQRKKKAEGAATSPNAI